MTQDLAKETGSARERSRLATLAGYEVLDTKPEEPFDRITRLASSVLDMPVAVVSLVDKDRQWFKSRHGMPVCETARDDSFCAYTIQSDLALLVPDALADARFRDMPLVIGSTRIRSYFGVPLRTREGHNIGALCVMDTKPRVLCAGQIQILHDLASLVIDQLELRLLATTDSLTGALSRRAFLEAAGRDIARARRHDEPLSCALVDADHFKRINDNHGHAIGDRVLQEIVAALRADLREEDYLGRLGGEEFAIMMPGADRAAAFDIGERLRQQVMQSVPWIDGGAFPVTVSVGVAGLVRADSGIDDLLLRADDALYAAKLGGRNRSVFHHGSARGVMLP